MQSRPRDDHTKRYVCAGRRPGHQLAIVADATEAVVAERVLALLSTSRIRVALGGGAGATGADGELAQALADLGSAQGACTRWTTTTTSMACSPRADTGP